MKYLKHNKIRQYNLKMLHNLLPFKINLCRWNLASDTSCMFCQAEETFNHIMLQCVHVSDFWIKVTAFILCIQYFQSIYLLTKKYCSLDTRFMIESSLYPT